MTTRSPLVLALLGALFGCDGRTCDDCDDPDAGAPPGTDAGPPTAGCEGVDLDADGILDLALTTVRVSGRLTFDGAPAGEHATLRFTRSDERASREVTVEPDGTFDARVVPGTYEIRFAGASDTCEPLPCGAGVVREGVALEADGVLDMDVDVVAVSGRATLNGAAWPAGARGSITFARGDDAISVALDEGTGAYALRLLPDTYDVVYASTTSFCEGPAPCGGAVLREGLSLAADGVVDVDVRAVRIRGALTLEGASSSENARLVLSSDEGSVDLGTLLDASYEVVIVPGTYDVLYQPPPSCSVAAPCAPGTLEERVSLAADGVLDVDVPSVTVDGVVRLNGVEVAEGIDRGAITFESDEGAARVELAPTGAATYSLALLPGAYDVAFAGPFGCDGPMPCGVGVLRSGVDLGTDGSLDLDVRAVSVSGTVQVDGAPAAGSVRVDGPRSAVVVPTSVDGAYAAVLLPGTYDLHVLPSDAFACDPFCGSALARAGVALEADGALDLAVATAAVTGRVTIDGAPSDAGQVALTGVGEAAGGASVPVQTDGAYTARVPRGRYVIGWTAFCEDEALCGNVAALGCE